MGREAEIKRYLKEFNDTYKRMPSSKECCDDLIIGRGSLSRILNRLEKKKVLIRYHFGSIPYKFNGMKNG